MWVNMPLKPLKLPLAADGFRWLLTLSGIALLYYLAARWSLMLAFEGSNASPVWPPSGIALAAMLLLGYRVWPAIWLGAFCANLTAFSGGALGVGETSIAVSAAIACGNALEALGAVFLLRLAKAADNPFEQPQSVFKFVVALALACMIAASVGTASLLWGGVVPQKLQGVVWLNWWLGDIGGIMLLTPLALTWLNQRVITTPASSSESSMDRPAELVLTLLLMAGLAQLIFGGYFSGNHLDRLMVYLALPALAWTAYRFGQRGVTLAVLVLAGIAIWATTHGLGPFSTGNLNSSLMLLVSFIVLYGLTGLVLAADQSQRSGKKEANSRLLLSLEWLTLLGLLALTVLIWHLLALDSERSARRQFDQIAQDIRTNIQHRMQTYEQVLRSAAGLYAASKSVEADEWHNFYRMLELENNYPGIRGLGFARKLSAQETPSYLSDMQVQGIKGFRIFPAGEREEYLVVTFIEPLDWRNQKVVGFDLYSEPVRRAALDQARDSGRSAITGKITLVQESGKNIQNGFLMVTPIYRQHTGVLNIGQRRRALFGFIHAPFRMDDLMDGILTQDGQKLGLEIFDGTSTSIGNRMYTSEKPAAAAHTLVRSSIFASDLVLRIEEHAWTLRLTSLPAFESTIDRQKAQIVLLAGLLISLLMFMLVRTLALTRENALVLAQQMTTALRGAEAKFSSLAESASEAIIIANGAGKVVSWNKAAHRMFGYTEEEVVGQDLTRIMPERFHVSHAQGMSRVNLTGEANFIGRTLELTGLTQDGREFPLELSLSTWQSAEGKFFSAIIQDISERKIVERDLLLSSNRLALAVEAAGAGIWDWDIDASSLTWDDRMYEMYQVDRAAGENTYNMWRSRLHPDSAEQAEREIRASVDSGKPFKAEFELLLPNGQTRLIRTRALIVSDEQNQSRHMIGINLDITEAKHAENALRSSDKLFRSILENAPIGMALVSLEGRWVETNAALSKIVGYSKQELQNLTFQDITHPDDLTSDLNYVEQLLGDAITSYQMQKRYICKNGEIVWVSLAASLMRNEHGAPEYFIAQIEDLTELRAREICLHDALLEKETLLKEVYHRVKNNLQVITSMFNLQTRILPEGQTREVMAKAAGRVYAMSLVHEKLYQSNSLASIGLHDYIGDLCKHFSQATAIDERGISFQLLLEPMEVELETAVPLGLILNELISNSLKHAFNQHQSGRISVTLSSSANGYVVLSVADDGNGILQKPGNSQPGLGLTLVATLCRQLDAELQSEANDGLLTTIRFKPVKQQNRL